MRRLPLRERRRLLEPLVAGREGAVRLSEEVQADGDEFFRVACEHGLEGIIAKHVEKPYRSGRGEWWQKITCKRRDSFVIVGFEPSTVPATSADCCWPLARVMTSSMLAAAARAGRTICHAS